MYQPYLMHIKNLINILFFTKKLMSHFYDKVSLDKKTLVINVDF